MKSNKLLLDVHEAMDVLSLGRSTVLGMAYEGILPSIKVGRRRLFPVAELEEWIAAQASTIPQRDPEASSPKSTT